MAASLSLWGNRAERPKGDPVPVGLRHVALTVVRRSLYFFDPSGNQFELTHRPQASG